MATRVINFYDQFTCLATDCPNTCCRGWRISIDDTTVNRYKEEKGAEGFRLRATMTFGSDKDVRKFFGRCANETKEGLCRLQLKGREELMPEVCRVYPRRSIQVGDDEEVTFELSCPLTAKLFLENVSDIHLKSYEGEEIIPVWIQDRFNEEFYEDILKIRDKVCDYIREEESLSHIINVLFGYFRRLHKHILSQESDIKTLSIADSAETVDDSMMHYYFYSFATFDKIIMNDLNDGRFKFQDPLHDFIKEYNKIFGQMTADEADRFFDKTVDKMINDLPALNDKYKAYLTYYLIQSMYSSYETATFYKEYLLGMIYLEALITTDVVDYINGKDMADADRQIKLLNGCERRFRHNVAVKKCITNRVNEEFIKKKEGFSF